MQPHRSKLKEMKAKALQIKKIIHIWSSIDEQWRCPSKALVTCFHMVVDLNWCSRLLVCLSSERVVDKRGHILMLQSQIQLSPRDGETSAEFSESFMPPDFLENHWCCHEYRRRQPGDSRAAAIRQAGGSWVVVGQQLVVQWQPGSSQVAIRLWE